MRLFDQISNTGISPFYGCCHVCLLYLNEITDKSVQSTVQRTVPLCHLLNRCGIVHSQQIPVLLADELTVRQWGNWETVNRKNFINGVSDFWL